MPRTIQKVFGGGARDYMVVSIVSLAFCFGPKPQLKLGPSWTIHTHRKKLTCRFQCSANCVRSGQKNGLDLFSLQHKPMISNPQLNHFLIDVSSKVINGNLWIALNYAIIKHHIQLKERTNYGFICTNKTNNSAVWYCYRTIRQGRVLKAAWKISIVDKFALKGTKPPLVFLELKVKVKPPKCFQTVGTFYSSDTKVFQGCSRTFKEKIRVFSRVPFNEILMNIWLFFQDKRCKKFFDEYFK